MWRKDCGGDAAVHSRSTLRALWPRGHSTPGTAWCQSQHRGFYRKGWGIEVGKPLSKLTYPTHRPCGSPRPAYSSSDLTRLPRVHRPILLDQSSTRITRSMRLLYSPHDLRSTNQPPRRRKRNRVDNQDGATPTGRRWSSDHPVPLQDV